ncbi:reprolysin-like metallopeptidase [Pseudomonas sp. NFACC46-3]|uniref:reprolysin-like metallopeptidase n=1 Tax=Pseudomonas sp. NFACC46-3 TaxID=1566200 RepID=UPI0008E59BC5|nr:hypothetical protein [Pseudomonas sp. NFACC46-3]SFL08454.1 hypothetical protein SAMN03159307_00537 [Pseudomonas sp. NFACC46-3]
MNVRSSFTATVFYRWATATLVFLLGLPVSNAATESQENTPQPTSASVYANAIGDARFERSAIHVEQGYTIESGNLYARDGKAGSLVVVRSPEGAVVGIVNEPDKHGLLKVDPQGRLTFIAEPAEDLLENDTVKSREDPAPPEAASDGHSYIDMLFAYSANALNQLEVDPIAHALAQVEMVNLSLRNSRVGEVSLRLGAVSVFDVPYNTSNEGLTNWQDLLSPYRDRYKTDVNAAIATGTSQEQGSAYFRGYSSVSAWYAPTTFTHEMGHNVGGDHCEEANGSDYNYGYNNGKTKTNMCTGSRSLYYSTPAVNDTYGLPIGNARTADMARVWRESAARLTGYKPELPGLRMLVVSGLHNQASTYIRIPGIERLYMGGIVALSADVGPTELAPGTDEKFTMLRVKLFNAVGNEVVVKLRGIRVQEENGWRENMNSKRFLGALGPMVGLEIQYDVRDNVALPAGYYNGLLQLEARRANSDWKEPINIIVSVKK